MSSAPSPPAAPLRGLAPIGASKPRILILGSMPGAASLAAEAYYAHPRNAFWPILGAILGFDPAATYPQRVAALDRHGVMVWDVLRECRRRGSRDATIDPASERANDFAALFARSESLRRILFNGARAAQCFQRWVQTPPAHIECVRLPSTSPAHASLSFEQKHACWRAALSLPD